MFKNKLFAICFSVLCAMTLGVSGLVSYRLFPSFEKGINRLFKIESSSDENISDDSVLEDSEDDEIVVNSNYLLNAEFNINQRGLTSFKNSSRTTLLYTVDRWRLNGKNSSYDSITKQVIIYKTQTFSQVIETPENLKGNYITGTFVISEYIDNIGMFLTDGVNSFVKDLSVGVNSISMFVDESSTHIEIGLVGICHISAATLEYSKIEEGTEYTGYYYKSLEDDFKHCQKYLLRINADSVDDLLLDGQILNNEFIGYLPYSDFCSFPVKFKSANIYFLDLNSKTTTFEFVSLVDNMVYFNLSNFVDFSSDSIGIYSSSEDGYIEFEFEIHDVILQ